MSLIEIVVLIIAVLAAGVLVLGLGGGFFSSATVGPRSVRGRLRGGAERDSIERDHDPTYFAPQGGHHPDLPGMRKPPNEGGLL
jgi:hypothetical protein